jgi:hypothetical protein
VEVVKSAQKEKVVRVGLLSLRNLLGEHELGAASDMVEAGLPKVLATRSLQVRRNNGVAVTWFSTTSSCYLLSASPMEHEQVV